MTRDMNINDLLIILEDDFNNKSYIFKEKNEPIQDYKNCIDRIRKKAGIPANNIKKYLTINLILMLVAIILLSMSGPAIVYNSSGPACLL